LTAKARAADEKRPPDLFRLFLKNSTIRTRIRQDIADLFAEPAL
jgi:hypothetical protein